MTNGFRAHADALHQRSGGFCTTSSSEDDPAALRLVPQAVARAKGGDKEALRFLYLQYADNVYGYVRSIVRDEYEAEDVTQHVFAKLMTVIGKYDQRAVPFFAWLLRLSHNVAIDHIRAQRATPSEEIFGADDHDEDADVERSHSVQEALATLPDEQRTVVVLRHVVGLTPGEIADRMGRTESSIHGLHHRGRRALRLELVSRESAPSTAILAAAA